MIVVEQRGAEKLLALEEDLVGRRAIVEPRLVVKGGYDRSRSRSRRGEEAASNYGLEGLGMEASSGRHDESPARTNGSATRVWINQTKQRF